MTAVGFAAFALALIAPVTLAERFRWLVRLGLIDVISSPRAKTS